MSENQIEQDPEEVPEDEDGDEFAVDEWPDSPGSWPIEEGS